MPRKQPLFAVCTLLCASVPCLAQTPPPAPPAPTIQERIEKLMDSTSGAWTPEQLATMAKLRDVAMQDTYALKELRHLTDNIGPDGEIIHPKDVVRLARQTGLRGIVYRTAHEVSQATAPVARTVSQAAAPVVVTVDSAQTASRG